MSDLHGFDSHGMARLRSNRCVFLKTLPKYVARAKQPRLNRTPWDFEHARNLIVRQALQFAQYQDRTVFFGQGIQHGVYIKLTLVSSGGPKRTSRFRACLVERLHYPQGAVAAVAAGLAERDGRKPGPE
jgi:hypothetical protein